MAQDFGNGVSRTLSAAGRQYQVVVWQASKPPLDSELNLIAQVDWERAAETIRAQAHSGFLLDPLVATTDFVTNPDWSNHFQLGRPSTGDMSPVLWANVNGWVIPVTGTANTGVTNKVDLWPSPESSTRIDMVFLEVWLGQVSPNPSTANKPSLDSIWKYGNVKFGGTNETDEMEDPTIGFETTERLQLQYRLRVVGQGPAGGTSVDLSTFPDGLDDPNMLAQGAASAPLAGVTWANMRDTLGDPGLWRAGNGDPTNSLNTVDGYSYAIPVCGVFRRNSSAYVNLTSAGNPNQNGALDRNPISVTITDPAQAAATFGTVTLINSLDAASGATSAIAVQVAGLNGSGFDNANIDWSSTFLMLGDEIIGIDSVATGVAPNTITLSSGGRGRYGTQAKYHSAGTPLAFYCFRPDGLFADQVQSQDILDLRRSITLGDWDYEQLLAHNLGKLFKGDLQSSYKQSGISDVEGTSIIEVDSLFAGASVPNHTEQVDGPDGIRTVFTDASSTQDDVTLLLDAPTSAGAVTTYVSGSSWEVGAGFVPAGYGTDTGWANNTIIDLFIGGTSGSDGARRSMRGTRNVRFSTPWERFLAHKDLSGALGNQSPLKMTFIGGDTGVATTPDNIGIWGDPAPVGSVLQWHPGPMYPLESQDFLYPFVFLGGIVNDSLHSTSVDLFSSATTGFFPEVSFPGADFDTVGGWWSLSATSGDFANDPTAISNPLVHGSKTLWQMLTNDGTDTSGLSSQLFIVIRGDTAFPTNNGLWRVIGAGSTSKGLAGNYTNHTSSLSNRLVVQSVSVGTAADFIDSAAVTGGVRSMFTSIDDGLSSTSPSAACVVITDLEATMGGASTPWNTANLSPNPIVAPLLNSLLLTVGVEYGPGRGAMARVPQTINRFGMVGASTSFLRQSPATLDSGFPAAAGVPANQTYYPVQSIQTWNRLSSNGLHAPDAPSYGGDRVVFSEMERESELFVDPGSKTVLFRPFQNQAMTVVMRETTVSLIPVTYPAPNVYSVDGAGVFLTGTSNYSRGYPLPQAYMPRFGRQDIPYFVDASGTGAGTFLEGVNHLFNDSTSNSASVFNMMGGNDNAGGAGVRFMFAQTIATATTGLGWGEWGNVPGGTPYGDDNGYQAQLLLEDPNIISSDVPRGLRGIQLPPFLGVARVVAVYDARDWDGLGAYNTDRVTPLVGVNVPINLLRTDVDKQTLYIVQGGGASLTDPTGVLGVGADDHTYVIPSDAIDITRSPDWTVGQTFGDIEYIVCFEAFGFARGFINKNNYVLPRLHNGAGDPSVAVSTPTNMILPSAAPYASSSQAYVTYTRPVYQGDPYMTRGGAVRTVSDYEPLYGTVPNSSAWYLNAPIQQFEVTTDYSQVPEKVNPRTLEVLAYADFWTTLGTGTMGGAVYAGTVTDVGHLTSGSDRIPELITSPEFEPEPRGFTQGQSLAAPRAVLEVTITDYTALANTGVPDIVAGTKLLITDGSDSFSAVAEGLASGGSDRFVASTSNEVTALNLYLMLLGGTSDRATVGVEVSYTGGATVTLSCSQPGSIGNKLQALLIPGTASSSAVNALAGMHLSQPAYTAYGAEVAHLPTPVNQPLSRSHFAGGANLRVNASSTHSAPTALQLTGLTERLPVGMLVRDYNFMGEDILQNGASMLTVTSGVVGTTSAVEPQFHSRSYSEAAGAGSFMGMSDGGINQWVAYDRVAEPTGSKVFRIHRGAAVYSLDPLDLGGPVHWASHMPQGNAVLKGGVLVGRAYLVRNYEESAFTSNDTTSYGDEVQMIVTTSAVFGKGAGCYDYALEGQISPTGYGKGYASSDRYRLEGKPLVSGHSKAGPNPDVFLAPYPNVDPSEDPCP
jgi:hypothetical protein